MNKARFIYAWLYDRVGYSNFKQRFWARSISWDIFWWDQDARLHMHIQEQNGRVNNKQVGTPDRTNLINTKKSKIAFLKSKKNDHHKSGE